MSYANLCQNIPRVFLQGIARGILDVLQNVVSKLFSLLRNSFRLYPWSHISLISLDAASTKYSLLVQRYAKRHNWLCRTAYLQLQWRLRFKIAVCHTEENYLKHVTLLNRFKIVFLLNRYLGLRETYLKPNIWVLESPGLGSRALKGQAVAVAPNRSVESAFRNIYTILPCVGGPTRSTILPCCVLAEYILLRIYCRINCSLSQGYSNIIYTL